MTTIFPHLRIIGSIVYASLIQVMLAYIGNRFMWFIEHINIATTVKVHIVEDHGMIGLSVAIGH
jgi:hypothetical protein